MCIFASQYLFTEQAQEPKEIKPQSKQIVARNETKGKEDIGVGMCNRYVYLFSCWIERVTQPFSLILKNHHLPYYSSKT